MQRRAFITLLGGAAVAWPLAASAQQPHPMRRIGILADERWPPIDSLKQGLRNLGYVEGQNLEVVYRFAAGQAERYPGLAAELVALPVEFDRRPGNTRVCRRQTSNRGHSNRGANGRPCRRRSRPRSG